MEVVAAELGQDQFGALAVCSAFQMTCCSHAHSLTYGSWQASGIMSGICAITLAMTVCIVMVYSGQPVSIG